MDLFSTPTENPQNSEENKSEYQWLKLGNKDGFGNSTLEAGELYDAKTKEQIEPFVAVLLLASHIRKLPGKKDGKFHEYCGSYDGLVPAPKFPNPFCKETSAAQIAQELKDKGLKDVIIEKAVKDSCKDGVLVKCCAYNPKNGALYPQCSKAKKDPISGQPGPCKPKLRVIGFNCSTESFFQMEVSASHLRDGKPFKNFITYLQQNNLKKQYVQVVLGGVVEGNGYAQLNFSDPTPIEDEGQKVLMDNRLQEVEAYYKKVSEWKPESEEEKAKREAESGRLTQTPPEDVIPF